MEATAIQLQIAKQLYQKTQSWKNVILEKQNFSMGGEKWGAPLFRPSDPIAWAE
jgi:hypothetical protein